MTVLYTFDLSTLTQKCKRQQSKQTYYNCLYVFLRYKVWKKELTSPHTYRIFIKNLQIYLLPRGIVPFPKMLEKKKLTKPN